MKFSPRSHETNYSPFHEPHHQVGLTPSFQELESAGIIECGWPSADGFSYFTRYKNASASAEAVQVPMIWGLLRVAITSKTGKAVSCGSRIRAVAVEVDEKMLHEVFLKDRATPSRLHGKKETFAPLLEFFKGGAKPPNATDLILSLWGIEKSHCFAACHAAKLPKDGESGKSHSPNVGAQAKG